jgi:hypothetical protein
MKSLKASQVKIIILITLVYIKIEAESTNLQDETGFPAREGGR